MTFSGRGLDITPVSPTKVLYDGVPYDLFDTIDQVKFKHKYADKETMRVECPACLYPTGIMLIDHDKPQDVKCSQCHNVSTFVQTGFGNWKIKSIMGTERIDERGKRWVNKRI